MKQVAHNSSSVWPTVQAKEKKNRCGRYLQYCTNQIFEKMNTEVEDHVRMKKKEDEEKSI